MGTPPGHRAWGAWELSEEEPLLGLHSYPGRLTPPQGPTPSGRKVLPRPRGGDHGGAAEEGPPPLKPSPSASTTKLGEGARQAGVGGGETGTTEAGKAVETSAE